MIRLLLGPKVGQKGLAPALASCTYFAKRIHNNW
jgi:hypothetical protein